MINKLIETNKALSTNEKMVGVMILLAACTLFGYAIHDLYTLIIVLSK